MKAMTMNKRQQIQDTALKLFVKNGYINTPVRDIIDGSGHGTSTFYRHFKNKEDVLRSLLEEFLNEIILSIENYYESEIDLKKRFFGTKKVVIEVFIKNRGLSDLYVKSVGLGDDIEKCIKEFDDKFIESSIKNISFGIKSGIFHDLQPAPIAHAILGIIKYAVYKWIVLDEITEDQLLNMVLSFHKSLGIGLFKD